MRRRQVRVAPISSYSQTSYSRTIDIYYSHPKPPEENHTGRLSLSFENVDAKIATLRRTSRPTDGTTRDILDDQTTSFTGYTSVPIRLSSWVPRLMAMVTLSVRSSQYNASDVLPETISVRDNG
ncbi:hypothetical protein HGRIS_004111 [Hohenbuehelia grisea]|uniref:Uncharacterized protein n=1 Tax=Hohenbuehelia grisea TaxID=104357 RepID=A0ABR3JI55_9AGAR